MFVLKILTTVWLTVITLGVAGTALTEETDTITKLTSIAIIFGQILAIAFMWQ